MPRKPDPDGYLRAQHFNVKCAGNIMFNRVTVRDLKELRVEIIQSVWSVEERRELSRQEINKLCSGK